MSKYAVYYTCHETREEKKLLVMAKTVKGARIAFMKKGLGYIKTIIPS